MSAARPCSTAARALCQPSHRARLSKGAAQSTYVSTISQPARAMNRCALATRWEVRGQAQARDSKYAFCAG
jgi:hypothetical protein